MLMRNDTYLLIIKKESSRVYIFTIISISKKLTHYIATENYKTA